MDNFPITARSLGPVYHINADRFERVYKESLSGYKDWDERPHCEEWLVRAENVSPYLSIDETALSCGEVYTILSNKQAGGRKGSIVAIVRGVRKEEVVSALRNIPESIREKVAEVTLDLSRGMHNIVRESFPNAELVLDRFHVQQLLGEAIQETRLHYKRMARMEEIDAMEEHKERLSRREQRRREVRRDASERRGRKRKRLNEAYRARRLENGDTRVELLTRSRYLLMCPAHKWTPSQKQRAEILFRLYPLAGEGIQPYPLLSYDIQQQQGHEGERTGKSEEMVPQCGRL